MRSGGDAGTAIHTSVPFGIAAIMASFSTAVKALAGGADPDKRVAPGKRPGATSGEVLGRKHPNLLRESSF